MAMTFSSQGCRTAAGELTKAADTIDRILNTDLNSAISKVRNSYDSETAQELYAAYDQMKAKFPEFIKSVSDCSNYLENTVAPAYENIEKTAAGKIG